MIWWESRRQSGQSLAFVGEQLKHLRGGHGAVPAELVVGEDHAAVLFAAKRGPGLEHCPRDDRRTDAGPNDAPPRGAHDVVNEARRAHGRDYGPAAALDRRLRQECEALVAAP